MKTQTQSTFRFLLALVVVLLVTGLAFATYNRPAALASGPGRDTLEEASPGSRGCFCGERSDKNQQLLCQ